jgi:hypothetical protein
LRVEFGDVLSAIDGCSGSEKEEIEEEEEEEEEEVVVDWGSV